MDERNASGPPAGDFIRRQVEQDLASGRYGGRVVTRFPPEPNGYLHVGHALHICLNFGIAEEYGGVCHLRFDDTNPETENEEFVRAIQDDIRWLGFDWGEHLYFASDYFERMYESAVTLVEKGLAYVDSQPLEAIREGRGTVTEPGVESPFRSRSIEESLDLFRRMRAGEFEEGAHVLRGKIDMASPNMLMRDPVFYRIRHEHHYRQGDEWCIYPLYDFAHCLEDAFEDVTHSLCTLEFDNNRELYDWVLDNVGFEEPRPHQYEWAGLDLENAVLSKRLIKPLVEAGIVAGWDDPRLSTIAAYRRRGVPPEALSTLASMVGVSKTGARTEEAKLDYAIRDALNATAPRVMAVLDPLRIVLTNVAGDGVEEIDAPYFPHDVPREGSRPLPFGREILIERADFAADPPKGFRRLVPGGVVRLRHARVIRCDEVVEDEAGAVCELRCSVVEEEGGRTVDGDEVKGTIHWVSAAHAVDAEVRLFGPLFEPAADAAGEGGSPLERVAADSLTVVGAAKVEPSVLGDAADTRYQFERTGYFWRDPVDGRGDRLVFNRIVGLKSTYRGGAHAAVSEEGAGVEAAARSATRRADAPGGGRAPSGPRAEMPAAPPRPRAVARPTDPALAAHFERLRDELGVAEDVAAVVSASAAAARFFDDAVDAHPDAPEVAGWMANELRGALGSRDVSEAPFDGAALGRLAARVAAGDVSRRAAKDVLARMAAEGGDPDALIEEMGLRQLSDASAIGAIVEEVLAAWPDEVTAYRAGSTKLIGLFVGEVMKASRGAADPKAARALLEERLGS